MFLCVPSHNSLDFRDLHQFKDFKECSSRMVTDFIERVCLTIHRHLADTLSSLKVHWIVFL